MKKTTLFVALTVSVLMFMTNCNGLKKMIQNADDIDYKATPEVLEMHNGKVNVAITGHFPEKYFNKKVKATITPTLVWEGGEKALTPIKVEGEKVSGNSKVINYKAGGEFSYNETFDYTPAMRRSVLEIRISGQYKEKEPQSFPAEKIADGIVATPDLVKLVGNGSAAKDKFVKDIPETKVAAVNYEKNKTDLKNDQSKKEEYLAIKDYVKQVNENERLEIQNVQVTSYASPEDKSGNMNQKVAEGRDKTMQNFVKKDYKEFQEFLDKLQYGSPNTGDWEMFKSMIQSSNLPDKDMIIRVCNMNSDPKAKEEELRKLANIWEELDANNGILGQMRKSELVINVMKIGHTNEEIEKIFSEDPSKLTLEELLYLGANTKDLNKQVEIYTKVTELFPSDWRGFNNLAVAQYASKNYAAAKTAIEKAKSLGANATILNNLANVQLQEGNIADAETNFKAATGVKEASAGQGAISIKKGQYENAVNFYGNACDFNAALAKLLKKDYSNVASTIDCGTQKDEAMSFYLKAITGARQANDEVLFNNLRTAVTKDSKLKEFAKNDVEFIKYFENETFKDIVK